MKTKLAKGYNLKLQIQNIHEKNHPQCGKIFSKAFNLKLHKQNVHEIEKISSKPHAYEHDWHFENLQKCKICEKEIIGKKIFEVHMENVHKRFKKI